MIRPAARRITRIAPGVLNARYSHSDEPLNFDPSPAGSRLQPPPLAVEDWNDLFNAVKDRLRSTVVAIADATHLSIQASVLECVEALEQLHTAQKDAQRNSQRQALQTFDAQTELVQIRNDLAGAKARELHSRHLSQHDGLTQLVNKSHFHERLEQQLMQLDGSDAELAVMYVDLDGFKQINDIHGHAIGDEVLKIIAARLTQSVRTGDVVGRLGGDEFACLLAGPPSRRRLGMLTRKLFDHVRAPIQIDQLTLTVRPSIGLATGAHGDNDAETLLKNADAAMFKAKRDQTGYAFFR